MNDPTAQMGFQLGKSAVDAGQQYMEQNVSHIHLVDSGRDLSFVGWKTRAKGLRSLHKYFYTVNWRSC